MYRILLFFLLLLGLTPLITVAQSPNVLGYVRDAETNEPLEGAFVGSATLSRGTYTNAEGLFILDREGEKSLEIAVQYLGYRPALIRFDAGDKMPMDIRLIPDPITLEPTIIRDQALRTVHPDPELFIKDYAFMGENMLLLVLDPILRRNKLLLLDKDMRPIEEHFGVGEEPRELFTDCMGLKHYLSKNYSVQVDWVDGELILQKDDIAEFERVVRPCRAKVETTYFFEAWSQRFSAGYYLVEQDEQIKKTFYWTQDSAAVTTLRDEGLAYSRYATLEGVFTFPERMRYAMNLERLYLDNVVAIGSFSPLLGIDGDVYIFDHNRKLILRFEPNGLLEDAKPMSYDQERFWVRRVFVDDEHTRAFTLYNRNGIYSVAEIDLRKGDIARRWELPKTFISNIQVKGNEIYFLYKANELNPVKRLYALDMNWK